MTRRPTTAKAIVDYVVSNFIKVGSLQKGSQPGFAHALKLSYNTIDTQRLSVGMEGDAKTLVYRYKLSHDVPRFSVGLLTALMDELSTDACYRVGLPCSPGLSLAMQTEMVVGHHARMDTVIQELDIVNVVTKLGKTISHTRTDFVCVSTNEIVACSSQIKYMPTGNFVSDLVLNNATLTQLYQQVFVQRAQVPVYKQVPLFEHVIASFWELHPKNDDGSRATFHVTDQHTNPLGVLHGGCHAMIMEQVAQHYAAQQLQCSISTIIALEAIHLEFLRAAGKGTLDVECETIGMQSMDDTLLIMIRVRLKQHGDRTCSEGKLRFSASKHPPTNNNNY